MSVRKAADRAGYRAFISYSHRDAVFAGRLHRRLERYVLPRRLGGARRLAPIFKDREELPAAADLSAQVRAALAVSDCLIVVCSPDAAASPWVGREIETFRALHPGRPILAALARGEPTQAFPPALSAGGIEPLAADFRTSGDGERLGRLKLAAGIAGVGVDQLVQRDAQRRLQGVMAVTAASVVGMLAMGLTTAFALNARAEAVRQRAAAEGLVVSVLTDIREDLKGAGRLSVRTTVNRDALAYYAKQDVRALPAESLQLKARVLLSIGEDHADRGDLQAAKAVFDEAYGLTEATLRAKPNDPQATWTHGQSVFWRGYIAYRNQQAPPTRSAWIEYRKLAGRLAAIEPGTPRSLHELAYADLNLCTLATRLERDPKMAPIACAQAIADMERTLATQPGDLSVRFDLANSWGWMAEAHVLTGNLTAGRTARLRQIAMLDALLAGDPENAQWLDNWGAAQAGLVKISFLQKDFIEARRRVLIFQRTFVPLATRDPQNAAWRKQVEYARRALVIIEQAKDRK